MTKRLRVKVYHRLLGGHVHCRVFIGMVDPSWSDEECVGHCGHSGDLVVRVKEWDAFRTSWTGASFAPEP